METSAITGTKPEKPELKAIKILVNLFKLSEHPTA